MLAIYSGSASKSDDPRSDRLNNFDFLRFVGAFFVVWGHSQSLLGQQPTGILSFSVSNLGLIFFFSISGYLIAQSWEREPQIAAFLWKRAIRIFPGLIALVLITSLVLGPILTNLSWQEYFLNKGWLRYLTNIFLYPNYSLPGVFDGNIYRGAVNGSLWSLPAEFVCYMLLALVGLWPRYWKVGLGLAVCAALMYVNFVFTGQRFVLYGTDWVVSSTVMVYFFVSACYQLFKVPLRTDIAIVSMFVLFAFAKGLPNETSLVAHWLLLPYVVITFGFQKTPILSKWSRFGDFSYGIYLYSFPIQQTLSYFFGSTLAPWQMIGGSFGISVICAFVSWHCVEKVFLRWKRPFSELPSAANTVTFEQQRAA